MIKEMTLKSLNEMLLKYKNQIDGKSYVLFIKRNAYEKIKAEIDNTLFFEIIVTDEMPDNNTQAIIMTKTQYDNLCNFGE